MSFETFQECKTHEFMEARTHCRGRDVLVKAFTLISWNQTAAIFNGTTTFAVGPALAFITRDSQGDQQIDMGGYSMTYSYNGGVETQIENVYGFYQVDGDTGEVFQRGNAGQWFNLVGPIVNGPDDPLPLRFTTVSTPVSPGVWDVGVQVDTDYLGALADGVLPPPRWEIANLDGSRSALVLDYGAGIPSPLPAGIVSLTRTTSPGFVIFNARINSQILLGSAVPWLARVKSYYTPNPSSFAVREILRFFGAFVN